MWLAMTDMHKFIANCVSKAKIPWHENQNNVFMLGDHLGGLCWEALWELSGSSAISLTGAQGAKEPGNKNPLQRIASS